VRDRWRLLFGQLLRRVLRGSGALMAGKQEARPRIALGALITALVALALCALRAGVAESRSLPPNAGSALASVASLACYSDGVACVHSVECCSSGCVNGQCGVRNKLKRRLAER
jgi:hypothetical protein